MIKSALIVIAAILTLVCAADGSAEMKEGLWEIATKTEMIGIPVQTPPTIMKQCMTKKDMVPKPERQEKGQECKIIDQKISGDTVTYAMECRDKGGNVMEISGKTTYKEKNFDGATNTTMKTKEQGTIRMVSKISGKYVGPCPK